MNPPELARLKELSFEIGPIRPPSEGGSHSLLLRATRNCPWGLCSFCFGTPYDRRKFQLRRLEEIRRDIGRVKTISELIGSIAQKLGGLDWASKVIDPYILYSKDPSDLDRRELKNFQSIANVFNWLSSGARTAFLQDADSLIMRSSDLLDVITELKETFPTLERITSYARARTLAQKAKTVEQLRRLNQEGLSRLHVGLESGDDELLEHVSKGASSEEHIVAGKKAKKAGFELSEYWMPGLGGKTMSEQHARNTARVLNAIGPDFIRSRRFVPRKGTPLYRTWKEGRFPLLSPHEELREIRLMLENLEIAGRVCFDHFINPAYRKGSRTVWVFKQDYNGYRLPEEKPEVIDSLELGLKVDESLFIHARDLVDLSL